jgi:hypothetical protein
MHTPGPWKIDPVERDLICAKGTGVARAEEREGWQDNARLIAAAPDMLAALKHIRGLIVEAAMVGFNCNEGDWAMRLFESQSMSHDAVTKATALVGNDK